MKKLETLIEQKPQAKEPSEGLELMKKTARITGLVLLAILAVYIFLFCTGDFRPQV